MEQLIAGLGSVLGRFQPGAGINDIADWAWLAAIVRGEAPPDTAPADQRQDTQNQAAVPPLLSTQAKTSASTDTDQIKSEPEPGKAAELRTTTAGSAPASGLRGMPFGTPGGRALPQPLEIARHLRPLIRRLPANDLPPLLDEETSIRRILDSDLWLPAFLPRTRPWLDLALVIEESPSMAIWQRTVDELTLLLSQLGAFRDLRRWRLRTLASDHRVILHAYGNEAPRRHKELLDPARRRLILIVSDCASPAWYGATLIEWLRDWGNAHPVGLLQVLPDQRLWARGALGRATRWALAAPAAGLANSQLRRRPLSAPPPRSASNPVPAMAPLPMTTLVPARLKAWARLVAGTNPEEFVGFVFRPARRQDPEPRSAPIDWEARLTDFHATATPLARRLACLLAAAPLRLPVMRLIQQALLPDSDQTHLAEFFLSGLIKRVKPIECDPTAVTVLPNEDPEEIDYDFGTLELRHRLLDSGLITDTVEVQLRIGDYVATHLGGPRQFLAALQGSASGGEQEIPAGLEPFARVTHEVLGWLGAPDSRLGFNPVPAFQSYEVESDHGLSPDPKQQMAPGEFGPSAPPISEPEAFRTPDPPIPRVVENLDENSRRLWSGASAVGMIRILHLSDLHFRVRWDADPVLRALTHWIADEVRDGLAPDLVVITGDLAFGGRREDYALARTWLEQKLWPVLTPDSKIPLPHDRLLLVPGNHDVDRGQVDAAAGLIQDGLLAGLDQGQITAVLSSPAQRRNLLKRHNPYLRFYGDWLGQRQTLPWWQRTLAIHDQRLHVAGLDSAWMACGDQDRGRLLLGRYQVNQTVEHPDGEGADWRLALMHHPWDYLAEQDGREALTTLHLNCDLVLRGHLHEAEAYRALPPDPRRACLELAAGSVYDDSPHPNVFQWIELWPQTTAEPRRVRVLFRGWLEGAWQIDRNQPGCPDGIAEFDMTLDRPLPLSVPSAYCAWLRQRYSGIDLLGQEVQQGHAVTLSQVYVPAVTTADRPSERASREGGEEPLPALLLQRVNATPLYCPGPAGAGKSTFCRWAVLQSLPGPTPVHPVPPPEGYAEPVPTTLRERLPLLVPLREFWQTMDCGQGRRDWRRAELTQTLAIWVDQRLRPDGLDGAQLRAHLTAGSAFLLLDGLDEVPVTVERGGITQYPRALLLAGLTDALPTWAAAGNRLLLTSRPYGLDAGELTRLGLPSAPLEPLPRPLQRLFVRRWFATLDTPDLTAGLLATLDDRADFAPLAENPLLLTALCVIYGTGKRLPEDRYHLYQRIVDNVLYHRYPGDARQRQPVKARLEAIAHGMHTGAGLEQDRRTPAAEASFAELERLLRRFADLNPAYETGRVTPAVWREEILTRSGLLLPRPDGRAAFHHLSFQEFLAAERIARTSDDRAALERVFQARGMVPEWRATLVFLFAAEVFGYRDAQWGLDLLSTLAADLNRAAVKANPALAVLVAEALEICLAKAYAIPEGLSNGFRRTCLDAIADEIATPDRQALGLCLGRLGDPRVFSLRDPAAYAEVPAGDYPYGEGQKRVRIAEPFLLSRYPVTNSQYREFMEDGGYANRAWWSEAGWAWRTKTGTTEPVAWRYRNWNAPTQPVAVVSFWEAQACCCWAGGRLPSEREWEAAARGPEGHEYAWGGAWEEGLCNSHGAGLGVTSPVGLFPRSRQARLHLDDLAGNVWEWCDDFYNSDQTADGSPRVLRGGCFGSRARDLRASMRDGYEPEVRFRSIGFRCVLAAPRQLSPSPI